MKSLVAVELEVGGFEGVLDHFSDLRQNLFKEVNFLADRHLVVDVLLKIQIGHFITQFKSAIIICMFLHCVIRQMNKSIVYILSAIFLTRSS